MNIEDQLLIARNIFPDKKSEIVKHLEREEFFVYVQTHQWFRPLENDADCFKVLLALQKLADIYIGKDGIVWVKILRDEPEDFGYDNLPFKGKTLNEAICRAYLNTIGEEG